MLPLTAQANRAEVRLLASLNGSLPGYRVNLSELPVPYTASPAALLSLRFVH